MYICVWRYPVNFSVHYNIHYITFTILVRETWNDYQKSWQLMGVGKLNCISQFYLFASKYKTAIYNMKIINMISHSDNCRLMACFYTGQVYCHAGMGWRVLEMEIIEWKFITFIRPNQEQLWKMQLYRSLAWIEPAALWFGCSALTNWTTEASCRALTTSSCIYIYIYI